MKLVIDGLKSGTVLLSRLPVIVERKLRVGPGDELLAVLENYIDGSRWSER